MKRADRNMISDVVDALQARPLRRRWSDDVKAQIVAESYAPGAVVSEVARRHEISPQLLSAWRKAARHGLLKPADGTAPTARRPAGTTAIQDRSSSSGEASSALGGPGPGHEFVQTRADALPALNRLRFCLVLSRFVHGRCTPIWYVTGTAFSAPIAAIHATPHHSSLRRSCSSPRNLLDRVGNRVGQYFPHQPF
jgi:transposase-like protein